MPIDDFIKELQHFSQTAPKPNENTANANYLQYSFGPFYFSNEYKFDKSIDYVGKASTKKIDGKINVALLVGESYFLSFLPELSNHADIIIIVAIEEQTLEAAKYCYQLMQKNPTSDDFKEAFLNENENILVKNQWTVKFMNLNSGTTYVNKIRKSELSTMVAKQIKKMPDHHFAHKHDRYKKCRSSLENFKVEFIKLDLLNLSAIKNFQKILEKYNAVITILNASNIFDYDANYAAYLRREKNDEWQPTGKLYRHLQFLTSHHQTHSPIVLFSLAMFSGNATSFHAENLSDFKNQCNQYIKFINTIFLTQTIESGRCGSIYKAIGAEVKAEDIIEVEAVRSELETINRVFGR